MAGLFRGRHSALWDRPRFDILRNWGLGTAGKSPEQGSTAVSRSGAVLVCADREAVLAGRRQRVRTRHGAGSVAVWGRCVLPPLLRRPIRHADGAHAELAGLGRDRLARRGDRHQYARRQARRRDGDPGRAGGPARVRRQGATAGREDRPCGAEDRRRRAAAVARVRELRRIGSRRHGAGHRQPVRRRPDGDTGHRFGARRARRSPSPMRRSSFRPMPRSIRATRAAHWSTCPGGSSGSIRPSTRARADRTASASPSRPTW